MRERFKVSYVNEETEDENKKENYDYLICVPLKDFDMYSNSSEISLDQLKEDLLSYFSGFKFEKHINSSLYYLNDPTSIDFMDPKIVYDFIRSVIEMVLTNPLKQKNYYIVSDHLCLILEIDDDYSPATEFIMLFVEVEFPKIFNNISYFLFKKDISYFFRTEKIDQNIQLGKIHQLVIINKPFPYSNCIEYDEENPTEKYSKFHCLNKCFKKYRLSKYFYNGNESGSISLNYETNSSIKDNERSCFDLCNKDNCKLTYIVPNNFKTNDLKTKVFKAYSIISSFEYYLQLTGLLFSFVSISFYQSFLLLADFRKFRRKRFKNFILTAKVIVFFLCLGVFAYFTFKMYKEYERKLENPLKKETRMNLFNPEAFNLIICLRILNLSEYFSSDELIEYRTFSSLENETKAKFNAIEKIYLKFQNKQSNIDWQKSSKVYFFFKNKTAIYTCFEIKIRLIEAKYQSLLSISKLVIVLNNSTDYLFFLVPEDQKFHTKSYLFNDYQGFVKIVRKKLKTNVKEKCIDYKELNLNCNSNQNCKDQCLSKELFRKYSVVSEQAIIDKDEFDFSLWNRNITAIIANERIPNEIRTFCNFSVVGCLEETFEDNTEIKLYKEVERYEKSNKIEIDLYYDVITIFEESPPFFKLIFDILSIENLIFGLNFLKLSKIISYFLKIKFNIKNFAYFLIPIIFLCFIGFLCHLFFIFNEIINGELIHGLHYEIPAQIDSPDLVFCFEVRTSPGEKEALDGYHLENITKDIRVDTVFNKIQYLNESDDWVSLDNKLDLENDKQIKIDIFFFLNKKCFKIEQRIEYKKRQFDFKDNTEVLKIYFKKNFINQNKTVLFFSKKRSTMALSKTADLLFEDYYYYINHENFKINYKDRFTLIKNPLSIYYYLFKEENYLHDVDRYINRLINNFKNQYNLTTLNLPLEQKNFGYKINDQLFEKFYREKQNVTDHKLPGNLNFQRQFALNHIKKEPKSLSNNQDNLTKPDFTFSLIFFNRLVSITNRDNLAKLILSMLNALSLWFDFKIFDLLYFISTY